MSKAARLGQHHHLPYRHPSLIQFNDQQEDLVVVNSQQWTINSRGEDATNFLAVFRDAVERLQPRRRPSSL